MASLIIGGAAGVICYWACASLKGTLGYDDSLDVFGVHGIGGTTGAILTGVFATVAVNPLIKGGLLEGNPGQLFNQVMAVLVTWVFAGVLTFVIAKIVDATVGLRVTTEDERDGLDLSQHGEHGYNLD
jgi:Amt family ammonium transporter